MRRCHRCRGTDIRRVRERFVDRFPLADGRRLEFVFDDFPQKVCWACGERYFEAKDLAAAEDVVTDELVARGVRDGAVFKHLRKALALKAAEMGDLLGVTSETISRWENGHNEADRTVWATLDQLVEDRRAGRTRTLDRLRVLAGARVPKRLVPLRLGRLRVSKHLPSISVPASGRSRQRGPPTRPASGSRRARRRGSASSKARGRAAG